MDESTLSSASTSFASSAEVSSTVRKGANTTPAPNSTPTQEKTTSKAARADTTTIHSSSQQFTEEEKRLIAELKQRDAAVRAHEQAHMAAGAGVVTSGPSYIFERGPDGILYAVGGEVSIDASKGRTPAETVRKMDRVITAALAPADPSSQDQSVAAQAAANQAQARIELAADNAQQMQESNTSVTPVAASPPQGAYQEQEQVGAHVDITT